ncbi:MAG TPA: hypothetical protein PKW82_07135 [Spirochaetales bacterium]|nr:hypothetical protein [Spirochaetales bacterium]
MKNTARILVPLAIVLFLASCQQVFTSSLGVWAARDLSIPADLSSADTLDYAGQAVENGDAGLATALLPALEANLDAPTPATAAYDELSAAAAATVVIATGISEAITTVITLIPFEEIMAAGGESIVLDDETVAAIDAAIASITVGADATAILEALALDPGAASADQLVLAAMATLVVANPGLSLGEMLDDPAAATFTVDALTQSLLDAALAQAAAYPGDSGLYDMLGPYLDVTP